MGVTYKLVWKQGWDKIGKAHKGDYGIFLISNIWNKNDKYKNSLKCWTFPYIWKTEYLKNNIGDNFSLITRAYVNVGLIYNKGGTMCPLAGEWVKKWYIHNGIFFSLEKEGTPASFDNMGWVRRTLC